MSAQQPEAREVKRLEIAVTSGDAMIREILEALCRRDGLTLGSSVVPGEPAGNYDLAMRLGIGHVFGIRGGSESHGAGTVPDDTAQAVPSPHANAREGAGASSPERPDTADPARAAYEAECRWLDEFSPGRHAPWDELDPEFREVYRRMAASAVSSDRARAERAEARLAAILLAVRQSCACPSCRSFIAGAAGTGEGPGSPGVALIRTERQRQVTAEGYTSEHDAEHGGGELAEAAAAYALAANGDGACREFWPFRPADFKPVSPVRALTKAGALIAAELDRITGETQERSDEKGPGHG